MRKAERTLSKSPRKKNDVVLSLAKTFQLRIMPQTNNKGRPKKELEMDEKFWLFDFLDRPDITVV